MAPPGASLPGTREQSEREAIDLTESGDEVASAVPSRLSGGAAVRPKSTKREAVGEVCVCDDEHETEIFKNQMLDACGIALNESAGGTPLVEASPAYTRGRRWDRRLTGP